MWTLRTFSGMEFKLTNDQAEAFLRAIDGGAKYVRIGNKVVTPNFEYLVSDEEEKMSKLAQNVILNDPDFRKWKLNGSTSAAIALDSRYPLPKYQAQWDEAKANVAYLTSLTKDGENT